MRYTNPPHSDEFKRLCCRVPRSSDVPQELFIPGLCDGASATRGGRVGQVLAIRRQLPADATVRRDESTLRGKPEVLGTCIEASKSPDARYAIITTAGSSGTQ
jgi:hypothetical protein